MNHPVIVIDIDNTITSNITRKKALIKHYLGQDVKLEALRNDYSLEKTLSSKERKTVFENFSNDGVLAHDTVITGSVAGIKYLYKIGFTIVYLSGRPSSLLDETLEIFEKLGLPLPNEDSVQMFLRDPSIVDDWVFKSRKLKCLVTNNHVVAGVGDHPSDMDVYNHFGLFAVGLVNQFSSSELLNGKGHRIACKNWSEIVTELTGRFI